MVEPPSGGLRGKARMDRSVGARRSRAESLAALLTVATCLVGCSSSGGTTGSSTPPSTRTPPSMQTAGGSADTATTSAVTTAFTVFFDGHTTPADSVNYLQHGSAFRTVLQAQAKGSYAQNTSATVSKVSLVNANLATVTFTLTSNGASLLTDIPGYAVRENGIWKVSAQSFCNLVKLEGTPAPACGQPANTALPK